MTTLLTALEAAVERYGRGTVTDPVALGGALHAVTDPPSEEEIDALVQVASTAAVGRLRAALAQGDEPERTLDVAVRAAEEGGANPVTAHWATALTRAALGLLPRGYAPAIRSAAETMVPG